MIACEPPWTCGDVSPNKILVQVLSIKPTSRDVNNLHRIRERGFPRAALWAGIKSCEATFCKVCHETGHVLANGGGGRLELESNSGR